MGINLGTLTPSNIYLGNTLVNKIFSNNLQIWPTGTSLDPDAEAFLIAAGLLGDPTIEPAINTLVLELKAGGVWSKLIALWPFVGGNSTTHKFNLINPADTNAAFRLTFVGGVTHNALGIVGNGTNGYAITYNDLNHYNSPLNQGASFGLYSTTVNNVGFNRIPFGAGQQYIQWLAINPVNTRFSFRNIFYNELVTAPSNTIGYFAQSVATNGTTRLVYNRTNTLQSIAIAAGSSLTAASMTLLTYQAGGAAVNSTLGTAYISQYLDSTEMVNLRTATLTFNSTLSR